MRRRWSPALLLAVASLGANAGPHGPVAMGEMSVADLYDIQTAGRALTARERGYLLNLSQTISWMNFQAWETYGRGLSCPPAKQRLTPEFLQDVARKELASERGWVHMNDDVAAKPVIAGLWHQYPCTDERVKEHNKARRDFEREFFGEP